jgi:adenine-specific DNA methylase
MGGPIRRQYWRAHRLHEVIADPFMGGGTPLIEASRLGFHVVGADVNPMACWIVRQALTDPDLSDFRAHAEAVAIDVEGRVRDLFTTTCTRCHQEVAVKYFIWVKTQDCPSCHRRNDLFSGYLLAENVRHPAFVLYGPHCQSPVETQTLPTEQAPSACPSCGQPLHLRGPALGIA